jgi:hypothetical protein
MRHLAFPLVLFAAACASAEGASDHFVVDTMPSGIIRITSDAPNGWRDSSRAWRFEEVRRFSGEEGTDAALVEPRSLAVDGAGRVYVSDVKPSAIKVFGPDGNLIRQIGREGEGPGEFRVAFIAVWHDRLVVHDPQQVRTSVFDTSGAYLTSWRSACCYWTEIGVDTAGLIYIPVPLFSSAPEPDQGEPKGQPWARYTMDGRVVDTLRVPIRSEGRTWTIRAGSGAKNKMIMSTNVPFTPLQLTALHPMGGFVLGWSEGYEIAVSPNGRDTVRLLRRAWQPDPIPEAQRVAGVERQVGWMRESFDEATIRSIAKLSDVPTSAPAFTDLDVDREGNVWARQLIGSDSTRTTWDVFDRRGVWLGKVTLSGRLGGEAATYFRNGGLYGMTEDDLGRPIVVHYRLARGDGR